MLKQYTLFFSVLSISLLFSGSAQAGVTAGSGGESMPIVLELEEAHLQPHLVDIRYEIYYPGFIEFHLFDQQGIRSTLPVWLNQKGNTLCG